MQPFREFTAIAAPLPIANVDTDKILAGQFLKTIARDGLGGKLFWSLRQDPQFVLNCDPWRDAGILIALENFGCGSSREHAPWALLDFGIRCIIAPSIADIFANNCFKNGILPIQLPAVEVQDLLNLAGNPSQCKMTVNLEKQAIYIASGEVIEFTTNQRQREDLLNGLDDITLSLSYTEKIKEYEEIQVTKRDWESSTRDILL